MPYPKSNAFEITYSIQAFQPDHEASSFGNAQFRRGRLFAAWLAAHLSCSLWFGQAHSEPALCSPPQTQATHHWGSDQLLQKDVGFTPFRESSIPHIWIWTIKRI